MNRNAYLEEQEKYISEEFTYSLSLKNSSQNKFITLSPNTEAYTLLTVSPSDRCLSEFYKSMMFIFVFFKFFFLVIILYLILYLTIYFTIKRSSRYDENDIIHCTQSKLYRKELRYNETSIQQTHFASPLALRYIESSLYLQFM